MSLIDLPFTTVNELSDVNPKQALWLCRYLSGFGPSIREFEEAVTQE